MRSFNERLQQVLEFLKPENLEKQTISYTGDTALLIIDTQQEFCDPRFPTPRGTEKTEAIADRIKSIAPAFRKLGIPVYAVYYEFEDEEPHFHKFSPETPDVLIPKRHNSAFIGTDLKSLLQKDGRKNLLTCGFNLNACVRQTVVDGIDQGFNVTVLRDLCGNDTANDANPDHFVLLMRAKGASIKDDSVAVLSSFLQKKNNTPEIAA